MLRFVISAFFREFNRPHHPPRKAAPAAPPKRPAPKPHPRRVPDEATPLGKRLHHGAPARTELRPTSPTQKRLARRKGQTSTKHAVSMLKGLTGLEKTAAPDKRVGASAPQYWQRPSYIPPTITGYCEVIDGDTIRINSQLIRLFGIDAPEAADLFGYNAKCAMRALCDDTTIHAVCTDQMSYNRVVATCYLPDGRDLAAELVKQGLAIDWPKFSGGKYARFETPDARQKMRRAVLKQQGRYVPGT